VRFVPGEVKKFSRIKLPPPLPRSPDSLPSGAIFEIVSVANCEEVKGGKCVGKCIVVKFGTKKGCQP